MENYKQIQSGATREELEFLINASVRIVRNGEDVHCPRCGKLLICETIGNSYTVACSDDKCISVGSRGL